MQNGVAWRSTNFALEQAWEINKDYRDAIGALECPTNPITNWICVTVKNITFKVFQIICIVLRTVSSS